MASLLVVGQATTDLVFGVDALPRDGLKHQAHALTITGGGMAANAAVAASRLEGTIRFVTRLGTDMIGRATAEALADEGIDVSHIRWSGGLSPVSAVAIDPQGERQLVNFRGADLVQAPGDLSDVDGPIDAVLTDTRWPEGALAALALARGRGVPGVIDAEPPFDPDLLALASHVAFSRPGLAAYAGTDDIAPGLDAAKALPGWVCVTDGAAGVHLPGGARIEAPKVTVRDTLGAGDVWHGAFALALAEGQAEEQAVGFANAAAALKCIGFGGRDASPNRAETERLLRRGIQGGCP
ncbi:MAG: PfkB family carbohydrate kinase [Pseudomonadota bacterium]